MLFHKSPSLSVASSLVSRSLSPIWHTMIADEVTVPLRYAQKWHGEDEWIFTLLWLFEGAAVTFLSVMATYNLMLQSYNNDFGDDVWIPYAIGSGIGAAFSVTVPLLLVSPPNKRQAGFASFGGSVLGSVGSLLIIALLNMSFGLSLQFYL